MTDNLKQRIAEAIQTTLRKNHGGHSLSNNKGDLLWCPSTNVLNITKIQKAVLGIVEPMIPKWMPINEAPKEYSGEMYGWCYGTSPRRIHWAHDRWTYSDSCMPATVATHCFLMPTPPAKE